MTIFKNKRGQATLELSLVIGALFLLLLGIVRIMGWFSWDMARRQEAFLDSRLTAGSDLPGVGIDYTTERLSIFGEE